MGVVPDNCTQVILVVAEDFDYEWPDGTPEEKQRPPATLSAWSRADQSSAWRRYGEDIEAVIGFSGVGSACDDSGKTPLGSFPLGQTFGHREDFHPKFGKYFVAAEDHYWDTGYKYRQREIARGKPLSPPSKYNHFFRASEDPAKKDPDHETENLGPDEEAYNLAVFVNHNPTNRPGWGCAIFLHCDDGSRTYGCIAIDEDELADLMTWLDPGKNPYISILVDAE